jgi:hypothetical protein
MELLGDAGHVESHFFLFRDNVSVGARKVHGLRQTYNRLRNPFGRADGTPRCETQVEAHFGPFGDSASLDVR